MLSDLLGRTGDDIELTPSPETEETGSNGVEHDHAVLSMAEIASCSYEARCSKIFIFQSPGSIRNTTAKLCFLLHVHKDGYVSLQAGWCEEWHVFRSGEAAVS